MEERLKLRRAENKRVGDKKVQKIPYRELIGSLMYLAVATRPDIAFPVAYLSQFNDCFNNEHWETAKRILRYLNRLKKNSLSPFLANFFMSKFEMEAKTEFDYFPEFWVRYVDDILTTFDTEKCSIESFLDKLSNRFPSI